MSAVQLRVSEPSDKQEVGVSRPEADDDTWTESSEGSTGHWNAADSDDEFVDAVEPPSSTGLALELAAPPLSGVYEDAVEATAEQVLEAMETTLSEGRQSTILEEEEETPTEQEEEQDADNQASEVGIEERVDGAEAAVKDEPADMPVDAGKAVENGAVQAPVVDSEGAGAEAAMETVETEVDAADEDAASVDEQVAAGDSEAEAPEAPEAPAEEAPIDSADAVAVEDAADAQAIRESAEAPESVADTEGPAADPAVEANAEMDEAASEGSGDAEEAADNVQDSSATDDAEVDGAEEQAVEADTAIDQTASIEPVVDEVLATVVDEIAAETAEVEGASASERSADDGMKQLATDAEEAKAIVDETVAAILEEMCSAAVAEEAVDGAPAPADESAGVESDAVVTDGENSLNEAEAIEEESGAENKVEIIVEDTEESVGVEDADQEASEDATISPTCDQEDEAGSELSATGAEPSEGVVQEVLAECVAEVESAAVVTEEGASEPDEVDTAGESSSSADDDVVQDIVQELTAAVESASEEVAAPLSTSEETTTLESEPKPDAVDSKDSVIEDVEEPAEEPAGASELIVPETSPKEVAIRSVKPSDDSMTDMSTTNSTQMAVTTSTTSLASPPVTHSTDGSDAAPASTPVQRWAYQIFGFTIENRVVLYHIHKTDRRSGIREQPILKRYSDFRELEAQLAGSASPHAAKLPRLPKPSVGTFIRGRRSKKTIEIREKAFRAMLKYIAMYPDLHDSAIFARFLEKNRDTHTGWM